MHRIALSVRTPPREYRCLLDGGVDHIRQGEEEAVAKARAHADGYQPDQRVSVKVTAELLSLIASGTYCPGDLLPPERTLASTLAVSRSSVREAMQELEARGLVSRTQGSGTQVLTPPEEAAALVQALEGAELRVREAMEVRLSIEPFITGLAALRSTPATMTRLSSILTDNLRAQTPEEALDSDIAFHLGLAQAARNPLLFEVDRLVTTWTRNVRGAYDTEESRAASYRGHAAIFEHVRTGDRRAAAAAMETHLSDIQSLILGA